MPPDPAESSSETIGRHLFFRKTRFKPDSELQATNRILPIRSTRHDESQADYAVLMTVALRPAFFRGTRSRPNASVAVSTRLSRVVSTIAASLPFLAAASKA